MLLHASTLSEDFSYSLVPVSDPTTLGSVVKVIGLQKKRRENGELVKKSPTGQYTYSQDVVTTPTKRRVGGIYFTASRKSTTTSPKPLTDKP